jgi:antitoxin component YwqK of YwqJK toxin-antitoxin module
MARWVVILLSLISLSATAGELGFCPPETKEVADERLYQGQIVSVRGCVNNEGLPHGPTWLTDGGVVIEKCEYLNGVEEGACDKWYSTGQKQRSMVFRDGKLHGETKSWHANGQLAIQAFYEDGRAVGTWQEWDEHGNLLKVISHP